MIKITDIFEAVNRELVKNFPDWTVYIDRMPEDFERPCFFIEFLTEFCEPQNISTVKRTDYIMLTCFGETDSDFNVSTDDLLELQQKVMSMFDCQKLVVGDRSLSVGVDTSGKTEDTIVINLQAEFFDERVREKKEFDTMAEVIVNKSIKGGI